MNLKKRLRYYYRYIISSNGWRKWTSAQVLLALLAAGIFLAALTWTNPNSAKSPQSAAAATLARTGTPSNGLTPTPFPPEFYTNSQQTIGITFAGAILVLIVVIGVIVFMPMKESDE